MNMCFNDLCFPDIENSCSFKDRGAHFFAHVGRYVGWFVGMSVLNIPDTCETYNWRMLNLVDFKLCTLININIRIISPARQVSMSMSFLTLLPRGGGAYVFYKYLLLMHLHMYSSVIFRFFCLLGLILYVIRR